LLGTEDAKRNLELARISLQNRESLKLGLRFVLLLRNTTYSVITMVLIIKVLALTTKVFLVITM